MLQVFYVNVYALLDPGASLYFVIPLVARKFDVLPDVLVKPFLVCTAMGDSVVAKRVCSNSLVMLPNRVTIADLVEFDMFDFYIILGMHLLHDFFASIGCRTRVVNFQFPNEPILEWKG